MFNHNHWDFTPILIHKTPVHYAGPPNDPSGGTSWNHAIAFLTKRFYAKDHICYTIITDQHPDNIIIDGAIANDFIEAYQKWVQNGC